MTKERQEEQRAAEAAIAGITPKARTAFTFWYRNQIEKLRQKALDNAKEYREQAEGGDSEMAERYRAAADTAEYYADQLQFILDGKTWDEAFVLSARKAGRAARRARR